MGARYYDARIGRWTSADTIVPDPANPQSLNRYAYVVNNPVKYRDPSGHVYCLDDDCNEVVNPYTGEVMQRSTGDDTTWLDLAREFDRVAGEVDLDSYYGYGLQEYLGAVAGYHYTLDYTVNERDLPPDNPAVLYQFSKVQETQTRLRTTGYYGTDPVVESLWESVGATGLTGLAAALANLTTGPNFGTGRSVNQMNRQIQKGKAPRGIARVDMGNPDYYEKPHVHFDDGSALNVDGTWKHGGTELTGAQQQWLVGNGWSLPK